MKFDISFCQRLVKNLAFLTFFVFFDIALLFISNSPNYLQSRLQGEKKNVYNRQLLTSPWIMFFYCSRSFFRSQYLPLLHLSVFYRLDWGGMILKQSSNVKWKRISNTLAVFPDRKWGKGSKIEKLNRSLQNASR